MGGYRDVPCGGNMLKRDRGALCRKLTHGGERASSRSESTVEMVQNILYAQIHIWQIMSTHLICHLPKISMGELLHHTLNVCGNEESVQREPVRNSRTQLNILEL